MFEDDEGHWENRGEVQPSYTPTSPFDYVEVRYSVGATERKEVWK